MDEMKRCPYCGKEILAVAKKCKHCGQWLEQKSFERPQRIQQIQDNAEIHEELVKEKAPFLSKQAQIMIGAIVAVILVIGGLVYFMNKPSMEKVDKLLANNNTNSAINMLIDLANGGDSAATYRLYKYYKNGEHVKASSSEAAKYLEQALKLGHPLACAYNSISEIKKCIKEELRNFDYYTNGDFSENYGVLKMNESYEAILNAFNESSKYIEVMAKEGEMKCMYYYGLRLLMNPSTRKDAVAILEKAKGQGCQEAIIILANCLVFGVGVEKDINKAVKYSDMVDIDSDYRSQLCDIFMLLTVDVAKM